ncbi:MAG: DegT/DnrJ/EryC1/StrS family aminotransferase, partial [Lachnospiraceae bacterium]|nr:DegT/DnrJ/EryC1/StrS family aminotransferase [Lachnospiraceae bacterium]
YGELPFGYDHKYVYSHFGYNLKATDMQAAVGCAQLAKFPGFVQKRKENFAHLLGKLKEKAASLGFDIGGRLILPEAAEHSDPSWFGFMLTCREGIDRKTVVEKIEAAGVQTRALFAGNLTKHPCFDEMRSNGRGFRIVGSLENTDRIMNSSFWVGVYPGMTNEMLDHMADAICEAVK